MSLAIKFELVHDTIAQQILAKATTEQQNKRRAERLLRDKYTFYLERGHQGLLSDDDLEIIRPYLVQLNLPPEYEDYVAESRTMQQEEERREVARLEKEKKQMEEHTRLLEERSLQNEENARISKERTEALLKQRRTGYWLVLTISLIGVSAIAAAFYFGEQKQRIKRERDEIEALSVSIFEKGKQLDSLNSLTQSKGTALTISQQQAQQAQDNLKKALEQIRDLETQLKTALEQVDKARNNINVTIDDEVRRRLAAIEPMPSNSNTNGTNGAGASNGTTSANKRDHRNPPMPASDESSDNTRMAKRAAEVKKALEPSKMVIPPDRRQQATLDGITKKRIELERSLQKLPTTPAPVTKVSVEQIRLRKEIKEEIGKIRQSEKK